MKRKTIIDIQAKKQAKEKIIMIAAYTYPEAILIDKTDTDIILIGDSVSMVLYGEENTLNCSLETIINHTKAVQRGSQKAMIVSDMPFLSYQTSKEDAIKNAGKLIQAGAEAVKIEGGKFFADTIYHLTKSGIPVMAHIGLTPQFVNTLGGFKVQGKGKKEIEELIKDAKILQEAGAFSIVLECVPREVAKTITSKLRIPTIGIGAGQYCDGQVLVLYDLLGLFERFVPKFVKQYDNLSKKAFKAINQYIKDVKENQFPDKKHSF